MYCNVYKKICIDTAPQKGKYNSCFNLQLKSIKLSYSPLKIMKLNMLPTCTLYFNLILSLQFFLANPIEISPLDLYKIWDESIHGNFPLYYFILGS